MKKCVVICFLSLSLCFNCLSVSAEEELSDSYKEYLQYLSEGWFGKDVSYDVWQSAVLESERLEKLLESETEDFTCVYTEYGIGLNANTPPTGDGDFSMMKGDVLVTNGTVSAKIAGHAGIAISSSKILHIAGKHHHPETITLAQWKNSYTNNSSKWTKFYRHNTYSYAVAAANWGIANYINKNANAEYELFSPLTKTNPTYCSKLVWQCYYFIKPSQATGDDYVLPYHLSRAIKNINQVGKIYGR